MKAHKITRKYIKYFGLFFLALLFSGYGNNKSHPYINQMIVESFSKGFNKFTRFENYKFKFVGQSLPGDYISQSGMFHPNDYSEFTAEQQTYIKKALKPLVIGATGFASVYTEKKGEKSAKEWIEHGGFSADVPEVHASLRHFYDPTQPKGKKYLTDIVNNPVIAELQSYLKNPNIDGVDWALGDNKGLEVFGHNYTWEVGKKYMEAAIEETDVEKRKNYMAKAWRSLGETLHMIADNGCPPHVRNDGHPTGNVDPYEEYFEATDIRMFNSGTVPDKLKYKLRDLETTREIAHELAVFTNKNFFTNETISGSNKKLHEVKHIAHPNHVYPTPKLHQMDYDDEYYHNKVGKNEVYHCTDKWIFSIWNIGRSMEPYIDGKCIQSQGKVLIPTIVEAGTNVIKLFIPELTVEITNLDATGNISGIILHKPNDEYSETITYSGPVNINDSNRKLLGTVMSENGRFKGKIKRIKPEVYAEIEFGGISVFSESVRPSLKDLPMKRFGFQIGKNRKSKEEESLFRFSGQYWGGYESFNISTIDRSFGKDIPCYLTVTGNRFTIKQNYQSNSTMSNGKPNAEKEILVEGELNKEKTHIANLRVKYYHHSTSHSTTTKSFVHLKNIPIKKDGRFNFRIMSSDLPPNKALDLIESLSQEYILNYPGEPTETFSMSKNDLVTNFSWDLWIDFSPNRADELFK